jgi:alpha-tubulin suppressor-like RCC1 family protein
VVGLTDVVQLTAGNRYACAVIVDGTIRCWGRNDQGQLGDGTKIDRSTPVQVIPIENAVGIGTGANHACAVLADTTARCWGRGNSGQLGDGHWQNRLTPVAVSNLSGVVSVAPGGLNTCALLDGGTVSCWGNNGGGQLGQGGDTPGRNSNVPLSVPGLASVSAISSGQDHLCVVANGAVFCWGSGTFGQTGWAPAEGDSTSSPRKIYGSDGAFALGAGTFHTCALIESPSVIQSDFPNARCWGDNTYGQLGNGNSGNSSRDARIVWDPFGPPREYRGIEDGIEIVGGLSHTCSIIRGQVALCWGSNWAGELGFPPEGSWNWLWPRRVEGLP